MNLIDLLLVCRLWSHYCKIIQLQIMIRRSCTLSRSLQVFTSVCFSFFSCFGIFTVYIRSVAGLQFNLENNGFHWPFQWILLLLLVSVVITVFWSASLTCFFSCKWGNNTSGPKLFTFTQAVTSSILIIKWSCIQQYDGRGGGGIKCCFFALTTAFLCTPFWSTHLLSLTYEI